MLVAQLASLSATMTVERVGVSFQPELLARFDALMNIKGYTNRSEAIRDLVRKSLIETEIETERGDVIETLTIIYDHNVRNITNRLLHLQHHHHSEISSITPIHVDEHTSLEVLVIRGKLRM